MLDELERAVETLDIPSLEGDDLARAIALSDRLTARIAQAVGEFDAAFMWALAGEGSMTGWLKAHARMSNLAARRLSRTAQRMRRLPTTAAAWRDGALSSGQVDAVMTI